jgi:hypothetical protein
MIQRKLLLASLCIVLSVPVLAGTGGHSHGHDSHGQPATLQLDAGKKWQTDAALRSAMGRLRETMAASLDGIHENRLKSAEYAALASKVEQEVGRIVADCKLDERADAQLHIVVGELLAGAERMAGKVKGASRQGGAVRVIGALDKYAAYFDDPGFAPIRH